MSGGATATPLQPLDRVSEKGGGGGSSTSAEWETQAPAAVRSGDTGATVPIERFVSGPLLFFISKPWFNEGGVLPSPLLGCQYWTYQALNGRTSLPMKIKSMTCFPTPLVKWVTEGFSHVFGGSSPSPAAQYKMH